MTEVNRSNFATLIPEIINKLKDKDCTFIAIDAEYTGLYGSNLNIKTHNSLFDSTEQRYQKLKDGFANYQISQFGLAIFNRSWERNEYFVEAYNIYLYPVAFDDFNERSVIQCQVSSMNFLAANNFDFNKFIREGVPYLNHRDRKELRQYFRASPMFMRWMEVRDRNYFPKFIEKLTEDDTEGLVQHLMGFTKVIHTLSELNKPIVGHNMLMDLILMYKQFYECLPPTCAQFKARIHQLFPRIYDSKHIAATLRRDLQRTAVKKTQDVELLCNTALFDLYLNTAKLKDIFCPFATPLNNTITRYRSELEAGLDKNLEVVKGSHCHEAGLDAVITGVVFLRLAHISQRRDQHFLSHRTLAPTVAEALSAVNAWKNHVNIVRAQIHYINLEGDDPPSDKPNWIRIQRKQSSGKILDVKWLRNHLPQFGDVEMVEQGDHSVVIACSAWGTAKDIWTSLEDEGYHLTGQEFPTNRPPWLNLTTTLTVSVALILAFVSITVIHFFPYFVTVSCFTKVFAKNKCSNPNNSKCY